MKKQRFYLQVYRNGDFPGDSYLVENIGTFETKEDAIKAKRALLSPDGRYHGLDGVILIKGC